MNILAKILAFFGPVAGSVAGQVNLAEAARAVLTALGASSLTALLLSVVGALGADVSAIFPDPTAAHAAAFALGLAGDLLRRLAQGSPPATPKGA